MVLLSTRLFAVDPAPTEALWRTTLPALVPADNDPDDNDPDDNDPDDNDPDDNEGTRTP